MDPFFVGWMQEGKNYQKTEKVEKFHILKCKMFSFEG